VALNKAIVKKDDGKSYVAAKNDRDGRLKENF